MPRNVRWEALKETHNTVGMAVCTGLSLATGNPIPFLVGVVIEAGYMLFVPDSAWYRSVVSQRDQNDIDEAIRQRRQNVIDNLMPFVRERYQALVALRNEIVQAMDGDTTYYRGVVENLDVLQDKFLTFASKEKLFSDYLRRLHEDALTAGGWSKDSYSTWSRPVKKKESESITPFSGFLAKNNEAHVGWVREAVQTVLAQFESDRQALLARVASSDEEDETRPILQKRADVLEQRQEHVKKLGRILTNLRSQLDLVQETFGLINDQIRARSPQQVLEDIESVVSQTDSTTRLLDEIAPMEQLALRVHV